MEMHRRSSGDGSECDGGCGLRKKDGRGREAKVRARARARAREGGQGLPAHFPVRESLSEQ